MIRVQEQQPVASKNYSQFQGIRGHYGKSTEQYDTISVQAMPTATILFDYGQVRF
jgi:hypothetical protein